MYEILGLKHVFSTFQGTVWTKAVPKACHCEKYFDKSPYGKCDETEP